MALFIDRKDLARQTADAMNQVGERPLLLHPDVSSLGVPKGATSAEAFLDAYGEQFDLIAAERTLLLPTFNYDYCRTGRYSVDKDPSQLGRFTEYMLERARQSGVPRTHTPVFNFAVFNNSDCPLGVADNPFGSKSTFQWLLNSDGWIGFFGAQFLYNTFIHFVEEGLQVPYRYHKRFPGEVLAGEARTRVEFVYRVKPMIPGAVDYDWGRLQSDLHDRGMLSSHTVGNGVVLLYRCRPLYDHWLSNIRTDPRYLLTEESRAKTDELFDKHGYPLTVEAVEGG